MGRYREKWKEPKERKYRSFSSMFYSFFDRCISWSLNSFLIHFAIFVFKYLYHVRHNKEEYPVKEYLVSFASISIDTVVERKKSYANTHAISIKFVFFIHAMEKVCAYPNRWRAEKYKKMFVQ